MRAYILLTLAALMIALPTSAQWDGTSAPWTQGSGTVQSPYQISTPQQLAYMAIMVNSGLEQYQTAHYRLTTDIDLNNLEWTPIGSTVITPFSGHFDGGGHTIDGLYLVNIGNGPSGLFGWVDGATIENCIVDGNYNTESVGISGGIVGKATAYNDTLILRNLENHCNVYGGTYVGGIVGNIASDNTGTVIVTQCINKGAVNGSQATSVGGIVGEHTTSFAIATVLTLCGNMGDITITGDGTVGGIIGNGAMYHTNTAVIDAEYCFNTGNITAIGSTYSQTHINKNGIGNIKVRNCYCSGTFSGAGGSRGTGWQPINSYHRDGTGVNISEGMSRTELQMKHLTFPTLLNVDSTVFVIDQIGLNDGYPVFWFMVPYNVTTDSASSVGTWSATLHGHYCGVADSVGFTYWNIGGSRVSVIVGTGNEAYLQLSDLLPSTQYRFRLRVTVGDTAIYGDSLSFTTYPTYNVIILSADTSQGTVTGGGIYGYNQVATLSAVPADECQFNYWSDSCTQNPRTITVSSDVNLVAIFGPRQYQISVVSNNATYGTVSGSGTYNTGMQAIITATANEGYHFVQWNDGDTSNPRTFTVTSDTSFTAQFVPNNYNLTILCNDHTMGYVTGGGVYPYGTVVTINATPLPHHSFSQWSDGLTDNPRTIIVQSDSTITAQFFEHPRYTITVVSDDSVRGTVSGSGTFYVNEEITITATAMSGYIFDNWSDGSTDAIHTVTVTGDVIYTAYFAGIQYTVNVYSSDDNLGTVSGSGQYELGTQATVTATPAAGCRFVRWSNGVETNPYTFTIYGDVYLIATFERNNGIENAEEKPLKVKIEGHHVTVNGNGVVPLQLYDMIGRQVAIGKNELYAPTNGVYLLRVDENTVKKIVIL